ncbi:hypothetical protein RHGRI_031687 [Rhododendron griersonianum]|uniref:AAA+ ATPase domain-containing protein n=1 Tax=Rhododendron griersonianum TaxID=479676 RepID=A0AAV6IEL2_9ERIC|nr:hypothetical protein RHGRI_031687 [Rhododendron griersonianum]
MAEGITIMDIDDDNHGDNSSLKPSYNRGKNVDAPTDTKATPWVEKYRPQSLADVAAHRDIVDTIDRLTSENKLPHLLLYGPPGTGKTSTILAVARKLYGTQMHNMVLELNASDERGIDVVRQQIQDFASTQSFSFGPKSSVKLVLLDEADAMTKDAQFALRRVIEKYTKNTRFALICNHVNKIIPALQSRCTRFRFAPLDAIHVSERLKHVIRAEGLDVTESGLAALVRLCNGDMRKALNILQKRVRLPKIGFSAEEWLTPLGQDFIFEPAGPGLKAPLQIREPTEEEMSRRNIPRPSIPTKSANPARGRGADQQQQQQKKQKLSDEAGQAALKAYDRVVKVTAERERYRTDRDNFRAKFKISESQLQETDAEMEKLKKELAEAKTAAASAEAEMEKMKVEEKKKLQEADAKGYEAGIKRAALEYTQTAHQMVNDELETRLPDFFELGYAAGAEAMAGVLVVETDSKFLQQLPPPSTHMASQQQITEEAVYLCTGNPLPKDIEQISHWLLNEAFTVSFRRISELKTRKGLALVDIAREVTMHLVNRFVFRIKMPPDVRVQLINDLADIEYRLSFGCNDKLQLGSLISTFTQARAALVAAAK